MDNLKKERVVNWYEQCFDVDIACALVGLSEEEKKELVKDKVFIARTAYHRAVAGTKVVNKLTELMKSKRESVALSASVKFGEYLKLDGLVKTKEDNKKQITFVIGDSKGV